MLRKLTSVIAGALLCAVALAQTGTVTVTYNYTTFQMTALVTAGAQLNPPRFTSALTPTQPTPTSYGGFVCGYSISPGIFMNAVRVEVQGGGFAHFDVHYQGPPPPGLIPVNGTMAWMTFDESRIDTSSYSLVVPNTLWSGSVVITCLAPQSNTGQGPVQRTDSRLWIQSVCLQYDLLTDKWSGDLIVPDGGSGAQIGCVRSTQGPVGIPQNSVNMTVDLHHHWVWGVP